MEGVGGEACPKESFLLASSWGSQVLILVQPSLYQWSRLPSSSQLPFTYGLLESQPDSMIRSEVGRGVGVGEDAFDKDSPQVIVTWHFWFPFIFGPIDHTSERRLGCQKTSVCLQQKEINLVYCHMERDKTRMGVGGMGYTETSKC